MEDGTIPIYTCPHCAQAVQATPAEAAQAILCPHCGGSLVIPALDGSVEVPEEPPEQEAEAEREDELDGLRIRQLSKARRAAIRSRSYLLIGAIGCLVAIGQLIWTIIGHVRTTGWHGKTTAYALAVAVLGIVAFELAQRAHALQREIRQSALSEPATPPDLSTLSDGSQQLKRLEQMSEQEPDRGS